MLTGNGDILNQTDMAADCASFAYLVSQGVWFAIQAVWTGSPVGNLKVQFSNDLTDNPTKVTNWTTASTQAISAAGDYTADIQSGAKWVRLLYSRTSGTGTITSTRVNTKGPH